MLLFGGDGAGQAIEVAADLPRRQAGQLAAIGVGPGEEAAHGMGIGPPRVGVADAGGKEFLPDERGQPARQLRSAPAGLALARPARRPFLLPAPARCRPLPPCPALSDFRLPISGFGCA